ncbi:MAG: HNH endonuclease [Chitinophagia bacterium]|nr:HNH endonuclease [Chitinophagia bacterium]
MADRDYREEYDSYHGTDDQKKRRAARNKARRHLEREGRVHKGDGKDIDHKDHNPMNNNSSNIRVRDRSANRSDQ